MVKSRFLGECISLNSKTRFIENWALKKLQEKLARNRDTDLSFPDLDEGDTVRLANVPRPKAEDFWKL